jgi:hypothetical protein
VYHSERTTPPLIMPFAQPHIEDAVALSALGAVYVEVPKVACSSIKVVLARLLGVDLRAVGGNPHEAAFPEAPDPVAGPKAYPGMFSFAFVRNPWDRLVSCYRDKILGQAPDFTGFHPARQVAYCLARFDVFKAGMPFERFVEAVSDIPDVDADGHFRSQHTFVSNGSGDIVLDFVGRFESLRSDFHSVCKKLEIARLDLPRMQVTTPPARYTEFYTRRTRDLVANRFHADLELFGYEFGEVRA